MKSSFRTLIAASTILILNAPAAWAQQVEQSARSVGVVTLKQQTVPMTVELPGRAVAFEQAEIRPRVDGIVMEKLYTPGTELKKGDPLFRLDDASYQATVAADEATVAQAKADLPVKQAAYDRAKKLEGSGYTTADVESARSDLAAAKATLQSAEAALKYARIQLGWAEISSPIDGVADVASVSIGDLVSGGQTDALTTVTTLDPMYVDMMGPVTDMLKFRRQVDSGTIRLGETLSAELTLEDGTTYSAAATMVTPSPSVSTSTGSVNVRFRFDNSDHIVLPGMFLRGTLALGTQEAYLVPQRAGEHGADGKLSVFVVGEDGKAQSLKLDTLGSYENSWIVREGVSEGAQLIVDGQKNLSAGAAVSPVAVTIQADGTTADSETSANTQPAAAE